MLMTEDSYRLRRDQHEKYFKDKQKVEIQKDSRLVKSSNPITLSNVSVVAAETSQKE